MQIVDFSENMAVAESGWIVALRSPKHIKLVSFPFTISETAFSVE